MVDIHIDPKALEALENFTLPQEIGFGKVLAPIMIQSLYKDGKWSELQMVPYGPISLDPTAKVFHYAQEIFEGLKAYKVRGEGPFLFRPDENAKRFNLSGARMAIPELPEEVFLKAVTSITSHCSNFIPRRSGESLYIRPFIFATEKHLGIKPSSEFLFLVLASPSGAYFSEGSVSVLIEREAVRAASGGTGNAKTGGNYAASLNSSVKGKELGFMQTLWLDAVDKKYIEEMSGMNFFCVIDGVLTTPKLTDTILDGITRKSLLRLAQHLGHKTSEESIAIDDLIQKIKSGECSEAFACGTAVIITPIDVIGEASGERYTLKNPYGPIAKELRETMLDIQEGRKENLDDWIWDVK